uniref:Uncharacterized protein n=1 Tax=Octopus bimaculoides TaxID=37653 RepID=A0A0L8GLH5_OCTBM
MFLLVCSTQQLLPTSSTSVYVTNALLFWGLAVLFCFPFFLFFFFLSIWFPFKEK